MEISVKEQPHFERLISVQLTKDEQAAYYEEARKNISNQVDVAGFRKGQAPLDALITKLGEEAIFQEFLRVALAKSYMKAISEQGIFAISKPHIRVAQNDPLMYEARVAIFPKVDVPGYQEVKIEEKPAQVTDKEVDDLIHDLRKRKAKKMPVAKAAEKGDHVEIDFQGYDLTGLPLEKTKSTNHPVIIGGGSLVKGFEEGLLGMKTGEKKRFPLTFPKDYSYEPFRGKTVEFDVEMKTVSTFLLPEIDSKFTEELYGLSMSSEDFKRRLKEDLQIQKKKEFTAQRKNDLIEAWAKKAKIDMPPLLISEEVEYMEQELHQNLERQGIPFEAYKEKLEGEKKKKLAELLRPDAEKRVKIRLMMQYLFDEEGITVQEEEIKNVPANQRAVVLGQRKLDKLLSLFL